MKHLTHILPSFPVGDVTNEAAIARLSEAAFEAAPAPIAIRPVVEGDG